MKKIIISVIFSGIASIVSAAGCGQTVYNPYTGKLDCIGTGGGGGGGSSTLAVDLGNVIISSPTAVLNFSSASFTATQSPMGQSNIGINFSSVASVSALPVPGGSDTNVQINHPAGTLYGDNGFQYDSSVSSVTLGGRFGVNYNFTSLLFNGTTGDPKLTIDDSNGTPGASLNLSSGGNIKASFSYGTGSASINVSTNSNTSPATSRIGFPTNSQKLQFNTPTVTYIEFDPIANASFTIPVVLSTITINSQQTDSFLSPGVMHIVATSSNVVTAKVDLSTEVIGILPLTNMVSSVTAAGNLVAGTNITLTPGAGITTISSTGGGSSGGFGQVNPGTIGQNAYYAVNGGTVTGSSNMITNTSSETFNVTTNHLFGLFATTATINNPLIVGVSTGTNINFSTTGGFPRMDVTNGPGVSDFTRTLISSGGVTTFVEEEQPSSFSISLSSSDAGPSAKTRLFISRISSQTIINDNVGQNIAIFDAPTSTFTSYIKTNKGIVFPDGTIQVTSATASSGTSGINNQNTLQIGSTFYTASGNIDQSLTINGNAGFSGMSTIDRGLTVNTGTYTVAGASQSFNVNGIVNGSTVAIFKVDPFANTVTSTVPFIANTTSTFNGAMIDGTGSAGTTGQLLTSRGNGLSPTWQNGTGGGVSLSSTQTWSAQQSWTSQAPSTFTNLNVLTLTSSTDTLHPVPTLSAGNCGTGSTLSPGATDISGQITFGGIGATCQVVFGSTKNRAPSCVVSGSLAIANETVATTTGGFTVGSTGALTSDVLSYICLGNQ